MIRVLFPFLFPIFFYDSYRNSGKITMYVHLPGAYAEIIQTEYGNI